MYKFQPILKSTIWGGEKIVPYKHIASDQKQVGESWELSGVKGNESVVAGGPEAGTTLPGLIARHGAALLGKANAARFGQEFPLLIKFIDARQDLSIQVHPNDALAWERHKSKGKTEMWYVVDADKGARLRSGFAKQVTPAQYEASVADNTITDLLAEYEIHPGDLFFLPAGRVHSIGAGAFIAEIQQTSDITYRIYDFNRKDADGNTVQATDEEQAAAQEAAKATAEEILAAYNSGKSLESIAGNYEKATYYNTTYYDGVVGNWLFDDARKDGDTEILEVGTNYYVGLFHSRGREEYKTVDIRHILITPETGTKAQGDEGYEDEQTQLKAAARTKAEEILAQWKSGEATEDSFAQLAMENSADGSKYDGGLYTRVTKGWAVEEFNDWCFDASRKDGDTGIVDTTYGSHVMYFVGYDLPAWAASVTSDLQEKAASEWSTALSENADVQQSDFGMKFVG